LRNNQFVETIAGTFLEGAGKIGPKQAKPWEISIDKASKATVAIKTFFAIMFSPPFSLFQRFSFNCEGNPIENLLWNPSTSF
jgi:hypothetical protein